jgi:hypothetical protein
MITAPLLVSIDPGVYSCAVAAWEAPTSSLETPHGTLYRAALSAPCEASQTAQAVLEMIEGWGCQQAPVCVEVPVKYGTRRSTHKDVERMLEVIATIQRAYSPHLYFAVSPFAWKGNVPKGIQGSRILSALTKAEHDVVCWPKNSLKHNLVDAIGIGLWRLGRLRRGSA